MTVLRCTAKLLKEIGAPATDIREFSRQGRLGSWHASIFRIERHKAIIFTNDKTLYSVVVTGIKKRNIVNIDELFREQLFACLKSMRIDNGKFNQVMEDAAQVIIGKTNNRSVLGSMNDHVSATIFQVRYDGGYPHLNMQDINERLNDTPMKAIGYASGKEKIEQLLGAT